MAKKKADASDVAELLKTMLIVELRQAGVSRTDIRAIVGVDTNRVTKVLKGFPREGARKD